MQPGLIASALEALRRSGALANREEEILVTFLQGAVAQPLPEAVAADLAQVIAQSGATIPTEGMSPLTSVHSTGAPGSLSTLLSPVLAAACGMHVPLVSVSGSVAGAIDSLRTLPGYDAALPVADFLRVLRETRLAHNGHSPEFAPADRFLWELRGRAGAREVPALIAASLLGKKLAAGVRSGVVDVRVGSAGNAGATLDAALETGRAIVNTARHLGMTVSCILSDAHRLPWPRLGRLDALLSLWEILTEEHWRSHPHVRLCQEIAAAACHAAQPHVPADTWRERVQEALQTERARETFEASILAHRASPDAVDRVRNLAATRLDIPVSLGGEPEPRSVSDFFKAARSRLSPAGIDLLGLSWRREEGFLVAHAPADADPGVIRELLAGIRPLGSAPPLQEPVHLGSDGTVVRTLVENGHSGFHGETF